MANTDRKLRVFLCHASQDKPAVRELYQRLKNEGWIDPWLDEEKLTFGQHWTTVIEDALRAADIVIIFLSHNSVHKEGFVQRELNYAWEISLEKPHHVIFLIPFRLDDIEIPRYLASRQWGDYYGVRKENTYQILLRSLKLRYQQVLEQEINARTVNHEIDGQVYIELNENEQKQISRDIHVDKGNGEKWKIEKPLTLTAQNKAKKQSVPHEVVKSAHSWARLFRKVNGRTIISGVIVVVLLVLSFSILRMLMTLLSDKADSDKVTLLSSELVQNPVTKEFSYDNCLTSLSMEVTISFEQVMNNVLSNEIMIGGGSINYVLPELTQAYIYTAIEEEFSSEKKSFQIVHWQHGILCRPLHSRK